VCDTVCSVACVESLMMMMMMSNVSLRIQTAAQFAVAPKGSVSIL